MRCVGRKGKGGGGISSMTLESESKYDSCSKRTDCRKVTLRYAWYTSFHFMLNFDQVRGTTIKSDFVALTYTQSIHWCIQLPGNQIKYRP